jgi:cytochrome c biogenesis protein CcdA
MVIAGLAVTLLGFLISFFSLTLSSDNTTRLIIVLAGIAVSLFGILGMINRAYLAKAIWRKD